jgi:hypothetical protein
MPPILFVSTSFLFHLQNSTAPREEAEEERRTIEERTMHPGAVAVGVGAAGRAVMDVRAAARASIILGLAMAAIALVAATMIKPSNFHAQVRSSTNSTRQSPSAGTDRSTIDGTN